MFNGLKQLLDWIYKRKCYFCKKAVENTLMCKSCYNSVEVFYPDLIKIIDDTEIFALTSYKDNMRMLIRALKYHGKKEMAQILATFMYEFWVQVQNREKDYEIVPVPLYKKRLKHRGYNHMELVAQEFSKLSGYSVNSGIVKRIKDTKPQFKLSLKERRENLKDAFVICPEYYNKKPLLILDDLCTTGSTIEEMVKEFKKANIAEVSALVAAVPVGKSDY